MNSGENMKNVATWLGIFVLLLTFVGCSDSSQRHYDLGKWYYDKGLINEAILEFKAATQSDPNSYQAHHFLAIAYTRKGWFEYALREAETSFDIYPCDENYKLIQVIRQKTSLENLGTHETEPLPTETTP